MTALLAERSGAHSIMDEIVQAKRDEVDRKQRQVPLAVLTERAVAARPVRDLMAALKADGTGIIAEVKARSPSKGVLREGLDFGALARSYGKGGAAAISVLADRTYFGVGVDAVAAIAADPEIAIPVIYKDFILDPYQVIEARAVGADAILIVTRAIDVDALRQLLSVADAYGLAAIVEVFDAVDLAAAVEAGAVIVGINNRDLASFAVDTGRADRMRADLPPGIVTIAESGIFTGRQVAAAGQRGFHAVLVGEALVTAADPAERLAELVAAGRPAREKTVQASIAATAERPGYYGAFGGQFVAETLMPALSELGVHYRAALDDPAFRHELDTLLATYVGRPSPLSFARRLTARTGGARIYLKREDLNHTGAHKINNAMGQALLAMRMGKKRVIAETGAGQHGVASATVASLFGLDCVVYMGAVDMERQRPNVERMRLLGAEVVPVLTGSRTLKDAVSAAIQDWIATSETSHYLIGSAIGPHPFPQIVRDFQAVIGREAREQMLAQAGGLPDVAVACVGGGSNAIGLFSGFLDDPGVRLVGIQAGGAHQTPAPLTGGSPGVLHGTRTYLVQDSHGQVGETHSIAPGLDYPAVGPQHAELKDSGRVSYETVTDDEALDTFKQVARFEGIIPALESAHAVAGGLRLAARLTPEQSVLVCLSGRGDKDLAAVLDHWAAKGEVLS